MTDDILILTGPVRTGKTTRLLSWLSNKNKVYGIATPIIENKRVLYDLFEKHYFPMEAGIAENKILNIGKYTFSKSAFKKAEKVIDNGMHDSQFLVIDEIGPLELTGEGFCDVLERLLKMEKRNFIILLVIRESILHDVLNYFGIKKYQILAI